MIEVLLRAENHAEHLLRPHAADDRVGPAHFFAIAGYPAQVREVPALDQVVPCLQRAFDGICNEEAAIGLLQQRYPDIPLRQRSWPPQRTLVDLADKLAVGVQRI